MENKKLAIAAVIVAPIIPVLGVILGLIGVFKYQKSSPGRLLSYTSLYVAAVTAATGLMVSLTLQHMLG